MNDPGIISDHIGERIKWYEVGSTKRLSRFLCDSINDGVPVTRDAEDVGRRVQGPDVTVD